MSATAKLLPTTAQAEALEAAVKANPCDVCKGRGWRWNRGAKHEDDAAECEACDGSGVQGGLSISERLLAKFLDGIDACEQDDEPGELPLTPDERMAIYCCDDGSCGECVRARRLLGVER